MPSCYANQLESTLRRQLEGRQPVVLLLWGEDAGAIRQSAGQAVALSGVDPADPFAADTLSLADLAADAAQLPDKASTIPFGGGRKLVRLAGVSGEEPATALRPLTEALQTALSLPLADVLILLPVPKLLDKSHALVKLVEQSPNGLSVRFFLDNERGLVTWLQAELRAAGKSPQPDALSLLASHLGADRELARRELEKLLLYVGNQPQITEEDVRASVAGATPADVFRLADAVGRRDPAATDRILQQLMEQGEDLNSAFNAVLRHLQRVSTLQQAATGQRLEDAVKALRPPVPAPMQADLVQQARKYPPKRLSGLSAYALEALASSRSGVLSADHVLSRAVLALSA